MLGLKIMMRTIFIHRFGLTLSAHDPDLTPIDSWVVFKNYDNNNFYLYINLGQPELTLSILNLDLIPSRLLSQVLNLW